MENLILSVEIVSERGTSNKSLYIQDIYDVVEKVMKIDPKELSVIQKCGPLAKSFNIGVKTEEIWNHRNLDSFIDERYVLPSGVVVQIQRAFQRYEEITVKNIPPHWGRNQIERIFSFYGTVMNMRYQAMKYSYGNDCKPEYERVWDGNWRVRMKIKKPIPSTLTVSDWQIEIFHRNQRKTCWRCGSDEHSRRDCETRYRYFINRFDMEEFPEIVPKVPRNVIDENENTDVNGDTADENNEGIHPEEKDMDTEDVNDASKQRTHAGETKMNTQLENNGVDLENDANQRIDTGEKENITQVENNGAVLDDTADRVAHTVEESSCENEQLNDKNEIEALSNSMVNSMISSKDEDMDLISVASPDEGRRQVPRDRDVMIEDTEDRTDITIAQVLHSNCSQNVKGALASPEHTDSASEGGIPMSMSSGPTPGQKVDEKNKETVTTSMENDNLEAQSLLDSLLTSQEKLEAQKLLESASQMGSSQAMEEIDGGIKRDRGALQSSTEEESDTNVIRLGIGSVVNSLFSRSKKKKRDDGDCKE